MKKNCVVNSWVRLDCYCLASSGTFDFTVINYQAEDFIQFEEAPGQKYFQQSSQLKVFKQEIQKINANWYLFETVSTDNGILQMTAATLAFNEMRDDTRDKKLWHFFFVFYIILSCLKHCCSLTGVLYLLLFCFVWLHL